MKVAILCYSSFFRFMVFRFTVSFHVKILVSFPKEIKETEEKEVML